MATQRLASAIQMLNSGKSMPAVKLVKESPELAAVISKLIRSRDETTRHDNDGNREITIPNQSNFAAVSKQIAEKSTDVDSIMQLFPDMELSAQILISSILSPKDMTKTELAFIAPDNLRSAEISSLLINEIKDYFARVYKIEPLLPEILREILFGSGSNPIAVIPENSIDELINGSSNISKEGLHEFMTTDGLFKSTGILGNPVLPANTSRTQNRISIESILSPAANISSNYQPFVTDGGTAVFGNLVAITDNPHCLKMPKLVDKARSSSISKIIKGSSHLSRIATESNLKGFTDYQLGGLLYKSKYSNSKALVKIKSNDELKRKAIGQPLIMKLPSESVIPVFTPGNEKEHVGYFVLIDGDGNPLSKSSQSAHFDDLQSKINNSSNNMSTYLTSKAKDAYGSDCKNLSVNQASAIYSNIVEADLLARLRNGVYGSNVNIGKNEDIYRIMLARVFKGQFTQLVYIPKELVTYFAYKYDTNGVGKSLMDDMRILNSLRAMVLFSKVMASLKNSIGRTQVALKLDERDPNPQKTIETAIHEISKTRQQYFPLGLSTPGDLVDWIQKTGYEYTFTGHPGLPDTSIEFSERNSSYVKPDDELEDDLRKRAIMATGLSPETVDSGFSAEFATTVVSNNLLLAKRVMSIQEIFIPQVADHIKKVVFNDGGLYQKLLEIVEENFDKLKHEDGIDQTMVNENKDYIVSMVVSEFVSNIEVSLPQPNSITLENQMTAFDLYTESLDKALNFYISAEVLTSNFGGEASQKADEIKNIVKAYFCRKWLSQNNVLPELAELTIIGDDDKPMLDFMSIQSDHINGLTKSVIHLISKTLPVGQAGDKDLAKITDGEGLSDSEASTSSDDGSADDSGTDALSDVDDEFKNLDGQDPAIPDDLPSLDDIPE